MHRFLMAASIAIALAGCQQYQLPQQSAWSKDFWDKNSKDFPGGDGGAGGSGGGK